MTLSQAQKLIDDIENTYSNICEQYMETKSSDINPLDLIPNDDMSAASEDDELYGSLYRKITVIHDNYICLGERFLPSSGIPKERFEDLVASYDALLIELFTKYISDANVFIDSLPSCVLWEFGITDPEMVNYAYPSEFYELQNKLNENSDIPHNSTSRHIVCNMLMKDIIEQKDIIFEAFKKAYQYQEEYSSYILLVYDKFAYLKELEEMIRDTQLENKHILKVNEYQLYAVSDICENEKYIFLFLKLRERQYWPYDKDISLSLFDKKEKVYTCSYIGSENVCIKRPYLYYLATGYGRYDTTNLFTIDSKRVRIHPDDKYTCHLDTDTESSVILKSRSKYKDYLKNKFSLRDKSLAVVENKSKLTNYNGVLGPVIILSLESLRSFVYWEESIPFLLDPDMITLKADDKNTLKSISKIITRDLKRHVDDIVKKPILNPFRCRIMLSDDEKKYILLHHPWEINKRKTKEFITCIPLEYPDTIRKKIQDNESIIDKYLDEMCKNGYLKESDNGKYECTKKLPLYCAAFFAFAVCHNHDIWVREINSNVSNRIFEYDDSGTEKYCFESIGNICSSYFEKRLSLPENSIKNSKSYALRLFDHNAKEQLIEEENRRLDPNGRKCYDKAAKSINRRREKLKEICDIVYQVYVSLTE